MDIEINKENRERLSQLVTALQDGTWDDNGKMLRPPLPPEKIGERVGVERQTIWSWRRKKRWPIGRNTLEKLSVVVGAGDAAFQSYFDGALSLKDLLFLGNVVRSKDNLEDVWTRFLQLEPAEQLEFESRLLMRRAESLDFLGQINLASNQTIIYKQQASIPPNSVTLTSALNSQSKDTDMAQVGLNWSDRELLRAQALLQESLKKNKRIGKPGRPGAAAIEAGVSPSTFDEAYLELLLDATLETLREVHFHPGMVEALAAICYEVPAGWDGISPKFLGEATYRNRPDALRKDLINHEHQQS